MTCRGPRHVAGALVSHGSCCVARAERPAGYAPPMRLPSSAWITTSDGRGAVPPSGHRVDWRLEGAALARVLDREEERGVVRREDRTRDLGPRDRAEELAQVTALRAVHRHREETVIDLQRARLTVGRDPEVAVHVERDVVRGGDGAHLVLREAREVGGLVAGIAAEHEDVPGERCRW